MKKLAFLVTAIAMGAVGLYAIPNAFYQIAGVFNLQDAAEGPAWQLLLGFLVSVGVSAAAFYASYILFRAARSK
jgi:hypothetical protein